VQSVSPSGSNVERAKIPLVLGPCDGCTTSGTIHVNFSDWATGRNEVRISANIPNNDEGNRQFQSTGEQICVRACSPAYRSGDWIEGRGWYTDREYQNARLTSPLSTVCSGCTISVRIGPGSGGLATVLSGIYVDPDFHHGSSGIVVWQSAGSFQGSVTLPILASGPHKLTLLADDGKNAGVLVIPFVVP
jgi:hypothetical protein